MMRSPSSPFDVREALSEEVRGAIEALDEGGAGASHAVRVRLKRARALARVGHAFAPGLAAVFDDSARAVMSELADTRNLSALAKAAHKLAKRAKSRAARELDAAKAAFNSSAALESPDLEAVRGGLRDLLALAQVWPEASSRQITRGAHRIARRARKAWRKGADKHAPEEKRHEWRQRENDRLYASAILAEDWPPSRPARAKTNKKLVRVLGREHDLALLAQNLATRPAIANAEEGAAAALKAIKRERRRLVAKARRVAARLHKSRA
jgi:hypothetical protein